MYQFIYRDMIFIFLVYIIKLSSYKNKQTIELIILNFRYLAIFSDKEYDRNRSFWIQLRVKTGKIDEYWRIGCGTGWS